MSRPTPYRHTSAFLDFTRILGETNSREEERKIVHAEIEKMKKELPKLDLNAKNIREYLLKIITADMLGFDVSQFHIVPVKLTQQGNIFNKYTGYNGVSLLLHETHELMIMVINSYRKDIVDKSHFLSMVSALTSATRLITPEGIAVLKPFIPELVQFNLPLIRRKTCLFVHRIYEKSPDDIPNIVEITKTLLCDVDPSVMAASLPLCAAIQRRTPSLFKNAVQTFKQVMQQLLEGKLGAGYLYKDIPAPFIQIKMLKFYAILGQNDEKVSQQLEPQLAEMMKHPNIGSNIGVALHLQLCRTISTIAPSDTLLNTAANSLRPLFESRNCLHLHAGVTALKYLTSVDSSLASIFGEELLDCLEHSDPQIRNATLSVLFRMCNNQNVTVIVSKLIDALDVTREDILSKDGPAPTQSEQSSRTRLLSDLHRTRSSTPFRLSLIQHISSLATAYSPTNLWFIRTIVQLLLIGGDEVDPETAQNLITLVGEEGESEEERADCLEMRKYTVQICRRLLRTHKVLPSLLLSVVVWVLGEFGFVKDEGEDWRERAEWKHRKASTDVSESEDADDVFNRDYLDLFDRIVLDGDAEEDELSAAALDSLPDEDLFLSSLAAHPSMKAYIKQEVFLAISKVISRKTLHNIPIPSAELISSEVQKYIWSREVNVQRACLTLSALFRDKQNMITALPENGCSEDVEVDTSLSFLNRDIERERQKREQMKEAENKLRDEKCTQLDFFLDKREKGEKLTDDETKAEENLQTVLLNISAHSLPLVIPFKPKDQRELSDLVLSLVSSSGTSEAHDTNQDQDSQPAQLPFKMLNDQAALLFGTPTNDRSNSLKLNAYDTPEEQMRKAAEREQKEFADRMMRDKSEESTPPPKDEKIQLAGTKRKWGRDMVDEPEEETAVLPTTDKSYDRYGVRDQKKEAPKDPKVSEEKKKRAELLFGGQAPGSTSSLGRVRTVAPKKEEPEEEDDMFAGMDMIETAVSTESTPVPTRFHQPSSLSTPPNRGGTDALLDLFGGQFQSTPTTTAPHQQSSSLAAFADLIDGGSPAFSGQTSSQPQSSVALDLFGLSASASTVSSGMSKDTLISSFNRLMDSTNSSFSHLVTSTSTQPIQVEAQIQKRSKPTQILCALVLLTHTGSDAISDIKLSVDTSGSEVESTPTWSGHQRLVGTESNALVVVANKVFDTNTLLGTQNTIAGLSPSSSGAFVVQIEANTHYPAQSSLSTLHRQYDATSNSFVVQCNLSLTQNTAPHTIPFAIRIPVQSLWLVPPVPFTTRDYGACWGTRKTERIVKVPMSKFAEHLQGSSQGAGSAITSSSVGVVLKGLGLNLVDVRGSEAILASTMAPQANGARPYNGQDDNALIMVHAKVNPQENLVDVRFRSKITMLTEASENMLKSLLHL
ncbi:Adaptor protein complex 4 (AP-4), epsilon subunit, B [Blattamonas nauphoetae]|uniref:Adaptor protein complex 4 (AP-4), epsilon subunit, B n=1 Tax=Blattamonas nauphoetae TaxID=2049346 RepID=A0ABQ9YC40_9EUKA|nr:Adaptor protein complex 4 (AP-4), epsilon subunit, B [Blattamonas nauphoetae]